MRRGSKKTPWAETSEADKARTILNCKYHMSGSGSGCLGVWVSGCLGVWVSGSLSGSVSGSLGLSLDLWVSLWDSLWVSGSLGLGLGLVPQRS